MTITRRWNIPGNPVRVRICDSAKNDYQIGKTKTVNQIVDDIIRVLPTMIIVITHSFDMTLKLYDERESTEFIGESERNIEFSDKDKGYIAVEMLRYLFETRGVPREVSDSLFKGAIDRLEEKFADE